MSRTSHIAKFLAMGSFRYLRGVVGLAIMHNTHMAKSAPPRWFLKQWRKHRGYTMERLAASDSVIRSLIDSSDKDHPIHQAAHIETLPDTLTVRTK